jgi:hypothetical protein
VTAEVTKYDPSEPRDDQGRWTSDGGGDAPLVLDSHGPFVSSDLREPTVEDLSWAWQSQADQYPATDSPGFHFATEQYNGYPIEYLLSYGEDKRLQGILNHYPKGYPELEKPGAMNMWVDPAKQRQGIGTSLLREFETHHGTIDWSVQSFSPSGRAMSEAYLRSIGKASMILKFDPSEARDERGRWTTDGASDLDIRSAMSGYFPHAQINLPGDQDQVQAVKAGLVAMARRFPQTADSIPAIGSLTEAGTPVAVQSAVLGVSNPATGKMGFNLDYLADPVGAKMIFDRFESKGWMNPAGWESIATHEFAHYLSFSHPEAEQMGHDLWSRWYDANRDYERGERTPGEGLYVGPKAPKPDPPSNYAQSSPSEYWAEAVRVAVQTPESTWSPDVREVAGLLGRLSAEERGVQKFDPSEPRDEAGRWTDGGGMMSADEARTRLRAMGINQGVERDGLDGVNRVLLSQAVHQLETLHAEYPNVRLASFVGAYIPGERRVTIARTDSTAGRIEINGKLWADGPRFDKITGGDWMARTPGSPTAADVMTHEFGHLVDHQCFAASLADPGGRVYWSGGDLPGTPTVSDYAAQGGAHERFAEAFVAARADPESAAGKWWANLWPQAVDRYAPPSPVYQPAPKFNPDLVKYDPSEPRDDAGRWTSDGSSAPVGAEAAADWLRQQSVLAPGATIMLQTANGKTDPEMARRTAATIADLAKRFPVTAAKIHLLSARPWGDIAQQMEKSGLGGIQAGTRVDRGQIVLNPNVMEDPVGNAKVAELIRNFNVQGIPWNAPGGDTWEGTLTHEFGHMLQDTPEAQYLTTYLYSTDKIASTYGYTSPEENWAEHVVSALLAPKDQWPEGTDVVASYLATQSEREVAHHDSFWDRINAAPKIDKVGSPLTFVDRAAKLLQDAYAEAYTDGWDDSETDEDPDDNDIDDVVKDVSGNLTGVLTRLAALTVGARITEAALAARLGNYLSSLYYAYELGFGTGLDTVAEVDRAEWVAEDDPATCPDCESLDGRTWVGDDRHPYPGESSFGGFPRCGPNCRCQLQYTLVTPDIPDVSSETDDWESEFGSTDEADLEDVETIAAIDLAKFTTAELRSLRLLLRKYSPDEPRDEAGRWTSDGAASGGSAQARSEALARDQVFVSAHNILDRLQGPVLDAAERFARQFPMVRPVIIKVADDVDPSAQAERKWGGVVHLSPTWYGTQTDTALWHQTMAQDRRMGWSVDATPEGIVVHELGHVVDTQLGNRSDAASAYNPWGFHNSDGDPSGFAGEDDRKSVESVYAQSNPHERFAEAFTAWAMKPESGWHDDARMMDAELKASSLLGKIAKYDDSELRDEGGRWTSGGGRVEPVVLREAQQHARAKWDRAPVPTKAQAARAARLYARLGAKNAESNARGSSSDRERRERNLLKEFGDGRTAPCVYCGVKLDGLHLTQDRLWPGSAGGRYINANLVPACDNCNRTRSDTPFAETIREWGVAASVKADEATLRDSYRGKEVLGNGTGLDATPRWITGVLETWTVPGLGYKQTTINGIPVEADTVQSVAVKYDPSEPRDEEGKWTSGAIVTVHDAAYAWATGDLVESGRGIWAPYDAVRKALAEGDTGRLRPGRFGNHTPYLYGVTLLKAANAAKPTTYPLYRGLGISAKDYATFKATLVPGSTVDLNLSSWTKSEDLAGQFARDEWHTQGEVDPNDDPYESPEIYDPAPHQVVFNLEPGAHAYDATYDIPQGTEYSEHLTAGKFQIVGVESTSGGDLVSGAAGMPWTRDEVTLRQVDTFDPPELVGTKILKYSPDQPRDEDGRFASGGTSIDHRWFGGYTATAMRATLAGPIPDANAGLVDGGPFLGMTGREVESLHQGALDIVSKINAAPPTTANIYRGIGLHNADYAEFRSAMSPGRTVDLNLSSWTSVERIANSFARNVYGTVPDTGLASSPPHVVVFDLAPGARALDVHGDAPVFQQFAREALTAGRFTVTSVDHVDEYEARGPYMPTSTLDTIHLQQVATLSPDQLVGTKVAK